jgi:flagellar capping protein FliD
MSGILSVTTTSNSNVATASSTSDATTGVYSVEVTQLAATTEASITVAGFKNYNDQVNANYSITVDGSIYRADTDYTINTHAVSRMSSTGIGVSGAYSTLTDLNNWINALSGAGLSISSSISGTPKNYNIDSSDIHVLGTSLTANDAYYKLYAGVAPGNDDKHAVAASLFQYVSLVTSNSLSNPYRNSSFTFTSDGSGNLILNAYDSAGNFLAADIQSVPDNFNRDDEFDVYFAKLNTTLRMKANYDAESLGAQKAEKIKKALAYL